MFYYYITIINSYLFKNVPLFDFNIIKPKNLLKVLLEDISTVLFGFKKIIIYDSV